jgi:hypothetical protein
MDRPASMSYISRCLKPWQRSVTSATTPVTIMIIACEQFCVAHGVTCRETDILSHIRVPFFLECFHVRHSNTLIQGGCDCESGVFNVFTFFYQSFLSFSADTSAPTAKSFSTWKTHLVQVNKPELIDLSTGQSPCLHTRLSR